MPRLIRMDSTGHSTLAEWAVDDATAHEGAAQQFRTELERGYIGMVDHGGGKATQVVELPLDAELVLLRRPIAGG